MQFSCNQTGFAVMLLFALLFLSQKASLGMVGVYGVGKDLSVMLPTHVDAVFVPVKAEEVVTQKEAGRRVFLSLNAFGGSQGWKDFPDARPVRADGEYLAAALGGVCPTHEGWRRSRLDLLVSWLEKFRGKSAIDGVWLDFIRYPGRWEQGNPDIPDTCYCSRCLGKFQADSGVHIVDESKTVAEKAEWIQENARMVWMAWKKAQVASFAMEAKQLIRQSAGERRILLGAFLVPWRKSDHDGAISFRLAQDAKILADSVDIFSPMVYHRMVDQPVAWVGEISDYYAEMTGREVWPIIQADKVGEEEFGQVVQTLSRPSVQGLLVFKHSDIKDQHWPMLLQYREPPNLLPNPRLQQETMAETGGPAVRSKANLPDKWFSAPAGSAQDSQFWYAVREEGNVIGITAGYDRQAVWSTTLPECRPGDSYLFSADFFREDRFDSQAYPEISLWGRTYRLNTHRMTEEFQPLKAVIDCPAEHGAAERRFEFRNSYPGNTFWMRSPKLKAMAAKATSAAFTPDAAFFPVGTYGASAENLAEIRELGANTAVIGMTEENIALCLSLNMRCTLAVPRDPEKLIDAVGRLKPLLQKGQFSFYVNDEPEIHSFPEGQAEDIRKIIKKHFPQAVTNMAIVRPQAIPFYEKGADYFMLDQYPVPNMPMAWLADSMDEAAGHVGRDRLQSVIQAFGDEKHAGGGWPRLPSYEEMRCLAFLSVVHGSRGIYFFTYPSIAATQQGRDDLSRLIGQLNSLKSWLQVHNDQEPVSLRMTSPNRFDPQGKSAVHCTRKIQHDTQMLICVNTLGTYTEAEIDIPAERQTHWRDYYSDEEYIVAGGNILARFAPYEVQVFLETK